jgi:hypothetical protein
MTVPSGARGSGSGGVDSPRTFSQAARGFVRFSSPRILSALMVLSIGFRASLGGFSLGDAAVVAGLLAWWPLQEWLLHVHVLHFRPRKLLGYTFDPLNARKHRRHHARPDVLPILFIPVATSATVWPLLVLGWYLAMPSTVLAATGVAAFSVLAWHYEWCHYLAHIRYTPEIGFYQRLCRHHQLHHFKNENYWFGVSMNAADKVLGTCPDRSEVSKSETARTLGISA